MEVAAMIDSQATELIDRDQASYQAKPLPPPAQRQAQPPATAAGAK
jgi:hypothetical protein